MAEKKVFTGYDFQGGGQSKNLRLESRTDDPTHVGKGHVYYNTTAGTIKASNADAGSAAAWKTLLTTDSSIAASQVDLSAVDAVTLDGKDSSAIAVADRIPIYGTGGVLKVNDPISLDDAANRRYVDSAVQGLDHKESVRAATTANIAIATALNNADTLDGVTLATNDRVLVKNQTTASENGIYIVGSSPARATDAAEGPNLLGDDGNFDADADLAAWNHNSIGTQARDSSNNYLKLTNASSGSDKRARTDSIAYATEIGKTYKFSYTNIAGTGTGFAHLGTTVGGSQIVANVSTGAGSHSFTWQATSAVVYIEFGLSQDTASTHTSFNDVSIVQVELTDGAFVFVEEGTANINSSWVLNGTAWTQFSGAGQIDVTSNGSASTAPLTKSGDTIDFRYSTDTLSLAGELIVNGTLDNNDLAGWTDNSTGTGAISASSNKINLIAAGLSNRARASQSFSTTSGRVYRFTYTLGNPLNVDVYVGTSNLGTQIAVDAGDSAGANSYDITATSGTTHITFSCAGTGTTTVADISVVEVDALAVKSGGIDTVHLADDAVTPAKLDNSGSFGMASLELTNGFLHLKDGGTSAALIGPGTKVSGLAADDLSIRAYNHLEFITNNEWKYPKLTILDNGVSHFRAAPGVATLVGIGEIPGHEVYPNYSAGTPSGTLHVATARFGTALTINGTFDNTTGWTGDNATLASVTGGQSGNCVKVTRTASDNQKAVLANFTVVQGRRYRMTAYVKSGSSGNESFKIQFLDGSSVTATSGTSSATWTQYSVTSAATSGTTLTAHLVKDTSTAGDMLFDTVVIQEDSLAAGASDLGNDLVVSGNTATGINVLARIQENAGLYFGDSIDADHSAIQSYRYSANGNSEIHLGASAGGTRANVMSLYGVDKSVKIEGGLGIGTDAGNNALSVTLATNDQWAGKIAHTSTGNGYGLLVKGGNASTNISLEVRDKDDANLFTIKGDGNASFPNGNVAIGATSTTRTLLVNSASNTKVVLQEGGSDKGFIGAGGSGFYIGNLAGKLLFRNSSDASTMLIEDDGTQDHQANSIVNSSTVQGLQDGGAFYDFDGAADYISTSLTLPADNYTVSSWVKFHTDTAVSYWFDSRDASNTGGMGVYTEVSNNKRLLKVFHDGANRITTGHILPENVWTHLCLTKSGGDLELFIDGVSVGDDDGNTNSTNGATLILGSRYTNENHFDGEMRDFKCFPSALTSGDVRKLYSGENPKKNNNVELIPNGTFDSATTGWAKQSGSSTASVVNEKFRITSTANDVTYWEEGVTTLTIGKYYKFSFTLIDGTQANEYVRVGTASFGSQYVDVSNIAAGTYNYFFKATSATLFVTVGHNCTSGSNQYSEWDNISVQEAETLVDFNSRSASSTKWYNQAIPSLYHGTLQGGVTLSAGSTDYEVGASEARSFKLGNTDLGDVMSLKDGGDAAPVGVDGLHLMFDPATKTSRISSENNGVSNRALKFSASDYDFSSGNVNVVKLFVNSGSSSEALSLTSASDCVAKISSSHAEGDSVLELANSGDTGGDARTWRVQRDDGGDFQVRDHTAGVARLAIDSAGLVQVGQGGASDATNPTLKVFTATTTKKPIIELRNSAAGCQIEMPANTNQMDFKTADATRLSIDSAGVTRLAQGTTLTTLATPGLMIGGTGTDAHALNAKHLIGFGYSVNATAIAALGLDITDTTESTKGSLIFATRNTTGATDVPTTRLTINPDGTQDHQANRIVNSQTVTDLHRTAEPSLLFSGTKTPADSRAAVTRKLISGAVTFTAWVKTTSTDTSVDYSGNAPDTIIGDAHGGIIHSFGLYNGSVLVTHYNGGWGHNVRSATLGQVNDGKWHQVGYTWDLSDGTAQIYIDGVAVAHDGADYNLAVGAYSWVAYNMIGAGAGGSGNTTPGDGFDGEIKDIRIHNRALGADEVAAAYNGESTPWKYADATLTSLADSSAANPDNESNATGHFNNRNSATVTSSADSWTGMVGSYSIKTVTTANNSGLWGNKTGTSGATGETVSALPDGTLTIGKRYVLTYTLRNHDISESISQELYTGTTSADSKTFTGGQATHTHRAEFTATGTSLYFALVAGGAGTFYVDNWRIAEAGEVAAYTPRSINDKWYDTTSNANHGTISGATRVGPEHPSGNTQRHFGSLTIKDGNLGIDAGKFLILDANNEANISGDTNGMYFKTWSGSAHVSRLEIGGPNGEVKATSGTSSNLIQVARVHGEVITFDSTTANVAFRITHNLGTYKIIVGVSEEDLPYGMVDVEVRRGDWIGADIGVAPPANNSSYQSGTDNNYCTIIFNSHQGNNTKYYVGVTG